MLVHTISRQCPVCQTEYTHSIKNAIQAAAKKVAIWNFFPATVRNNFYAKFHTLYIVINHHAYVAGHYVHLISTLKIKKFEM